MPKGDTRPLHNLQRLAGIPFEKLEYEGVQVPQAVIPVQDQSQLGCLEGCEQWALLNVTVATLGISYLSQCENADGELCLPEYDTYVHSGGIYHNASGSTFKWMPILQYQGRMGYNVALDEEKTCTILQYWQLGWTFNLLLPPGWTVGFLHGAIGGTADFNVVFNAKLLRRNTF